LHLRYKCRCGRFEQSAKPALWALVLAWSIGQNWWTSAGPPLAGGPALVCSKMPANRFGCIACTASTRSPTLALGSSPVGTDLNPQAHRQPMGRTFFRWRIISETISIVLFSTSLCLLLKIKLSLTRWINLSAYVDIQKIG
jgi:hypothetical protein